VPEPEPAPAREADLYQVEPGQFTAARNALAKQLKAEGQRDEATRIGKLRRPPVTAWALNQVARLQPDLIGDVLETGGRLRAAMQKAVDGDASGLRDAQGAQRRAADAAVAAAAARLEAAGHPANDAARQRIGATVGAAVVDDTVAEELRSGVLDGDRSAPGFGLDSLTLGDAPLPKPAKPAASAASAASTASTDKTDKAAAPAALPVKTASQRKAEAPLRERLRQARARHAELEAEASRLARKADRLATRADEAERQAASARAEADEARAEADEARRQADAAKPDESEP
jgi:hypothetical protein